MSSDLLRVVKYFSDAPQQRLRGDISESDRKSIACCCNTVHIQTLVAEYRNPKQRHASLHSFLCAQQSTVRNEQSDVGMSYRTHSTQRFNCTKRLRRHFLSARLCISLSISLSIYPHTVLFYLLLCLIIYLNIYIYISIYLPTYLSINQSIISSPIHDFL